MTTRARFAGRSLAEGCGPRSRRPTIEDEVFTNSAAGFHDGGGANGNPHDESVPAAGLVRGRR